jgi:peroxiredoxin Q/BCP
MEEFEKLDAQIIGVSTDIMETLQKFVSEERIGFPLVSDTGKKIKKDYGDGRITYLIDKKSIIRYIQKRVPNNHDFIEKLKSLQ